MSVRWPFRRETAVKHALGPAVTAIPSGPMTPSAPAPPAPAVQRFPERAEPDARAAAVVAAPPVVLPVQRSMAAPPAEAEPVAVTPVPVSVPVQPVPAAPQAEEPLPVELVDVAPLPAQPVRPVSPAEPVDLAPVDLPPLVSAPTPPAPTAAAVVHPPAVPVQQVDESHDTLPIEAMLAVAEVVQAPLPAHPDGQPQGPRPEPTAPVVHVAPATTQVDGPRVELGFSDGTYRMLDPASDAARALSDLVAEMTSGSPARPPRQAAADDSPGPGGSGTP